MEQKTFSRSGLAVFSSNSLRLGREEVNLESIYCWWIIGYGGAKWIEGWKSFFMIEWFALDWTAEQIRLYVLIIWLFSVIWFIVGVIKPELRFY
ncbi:hypothetical protein [Psychrobacter sp. TB2]|uniref:hypothetical protein n=1 Tax=Psychrobacter sp. TB20-MNA-CIBAN-0197 TaxID=3140453 RepID=UPI001D0D0595|nr:hypothetical protein [Psychrobacter sp. TB2]